MKRVYLSLLFLVLMGFASSASACQTCRRWADLWVCWQDGLTGWEWCYETSGYCYGGGWCDSGLAAPSPLAAGEEVCADGVLGCRDAAPAGFVLEQPAEAVAAQLPEEKQAG